MIHGKDYQLKKSINQIPKTTFPVIWNDAHYPLYQSLSVIVFNRHFDGYYNIMNELIEEGITKVYFLISKGHFKKEYSFFNFLYAGIRNDMTNYIHHYKKLTFHSDELLEDQAADEGIEGEYLNSSILLDPNLAFYVWGLFKETYPMVDIFDFDSQEEQDNYIALIGKIMGIDLKQFIDNNQQDVILALLHFFSGQTVKVPDDTKAELCLRRSKCFTLHQQGYSPEQIKEKTGYKVTFINNSIKYCLENISTS